MLSRCANICCLGSSVVNVRPSVKTNELVAFSLFYLFICLFISFFWTQPLTDHCSTYLPIVHPTKQDSRTSRLKRAPSFLATLQAGEPQPWSAWNWFEVQRRELYFSVDMTTRIDENDSIVDSTTKKAPPYTITTYTITIITASLTQNNKFMTTLIIFNL